MRPLGDAAGGRGDRGSTALAPRPRRAARGPGAGRRVPVRAARLRPARRSAHPRAAVRAPAGPRCRAIAARSARAGSRCRRGRAGLAAAAGAGWLRSRAASASGPTRARSALLVHELKFHGRRRVAARLAEALLASAELRGGCSPARTCWCRCPCIRGAGASAASTSPSSWPARSPAPSRPARGARTPWCGARTRRPRPACRAAAAARNVAGAFAVRRRPQVAGRIVVLVDDVVTTGATARACARALLAGRGARGAAGDGGARRLSARSRTSRRNT